MTPLQKAAQYAFDILVSCDPLPCEREAAEGLQKALEAEIAQTVEPIQRHLPENVARLLIERYLKDEHGYADVSYSVEKQGYAGHESHSWAFWILSDDSTSYLHEDGRIEWCGTAWEPTEQAQAVEPAAWITDHDEPLLCITESEAASFCEDGQHRPTPLYLHPPKPQATTPVPEGYVLVPIKPTEEMLAAWRQRNHSYSPESFETHEDALDWMNTYSYKAMLEAAKG